MGFWVLYQDVCLLFCFFRLQISLKILILVWVLLFLILTKSLGLNKYRVECCIDIYFRFFCRIPITSKVFCFVLFFVFFFPNLGIEYDLGLNFLVGLLYLARLRPPKPQSQRETVLKAHIGMRSKSFKGKKNQF